MCWQRFHQIGLKLVTISLVWVFSTALYFCLEAQAAAPTISFEPATVTANVGETITVAVKLQGVAAKVSGADVKIKYDPTVLEAIAITESEPLESCGIFKTSNKFTAKNEITNSNGTAWFVTALFDGQVPGAGNDILLKIKFKALKAGDAQLAFEKAEVSDAGTPVQLMKLSALTPGVVKINAGGVPGNPGGGGGSNSNINKPATDPKAEKYSAESTQETGKTDDINIQAKTFSDITGHWASKSIESLAQKNIIQGYAHNLFKPEAKISRLEFALLVGRILGLTQPDQQQTLPFNDSNKVPEWARDALPAVAAQGIVKGDEAGNFRPGNSITRAEIAAILVRALDLAVPDVTAGKVALKDYAAVNWASGAVLTAYQSGLIGGYPDGTFKPANLATRAEASVMILRALNYLEARQQTS
jgi:hypothetical protein